VKGWLPNTGEVDRGRGVMGRWVYGGVRYHGGDMVT